MAQTVGIIGAGTVGQQVARYLIDIGTGVVLSNSRGPSSLGGVVAGLGSGASAGSVAAAAEADVVVLAVPYGVVAETLRPLPDWGGRILVDATNAIKSFGPQGMELYDLGGRTSSEIVAGLAPGARVVKAFNNRSYPLPATPPDAPGERYVQFLSGDDAGAKAVVRTLLGHIGFAPVDLGDLATGGRLQQVGGPLAGRDFRLAKARVAKG